MDFEVSAVVGCAVVDVAVDYEFVVAVENDAADVTVAENPEASAPVELPVYRFDFQYEA